MSKSSILPPSIPKEPLDLQDSTGGPDQRSRDEARQLSSGRSAEQLAATARENEADRTEVFRNHFERLAVWTLYLVWFILVVFGLIYVYHIIAPPDLPRLPDEQVGRLQAIVTGGAVIGLVRGQTKRRLDDPD